MTDAKWRQGTVLKGEDLRGIALCKILSQNMIMKGFRYQIGVNEEVNHSCSEKGLHFSTVQDIGCYLDYGEKLAIVTVPNNEKIYVDAHGFHAYRLNIERILPLNKSAAWEFLMKNGAPISGQKPLAICYAAQKGYLDVIKYLYENGADITARSQFPVRWAAKNGHLEVVKYLHKNGADITAFDNFAVRWAAAGGYLEVVKYLHENGADITAHGNEAICRAVAGGYLAMVKYLHRHGADIAACDHRIVRWAAKYGYTDIVRYLHKSKWRQFFCAT